MPSRSKISQIQKPCFNINGCATLWTIALKWPIFKRKKGFANISLGLNYCSMGTSWPRSHDTVPLIHFIISYLHCSAHTFVANVKFFLNRIIWNALPKKITPLAWVYLAPSRCKPSIEIFYAQNADYRISYWFSRTGLLLGVTYSRPH
jgi:hypothetical protein